LDGRWEYFDPPLEIFVAVRCEDGYGYKVQIQIPIPIWYTNTNMEYNTELDMYTYMEDLSHLVWDHFPPKKCKRRGGGLKIETF